MLARREARTETIREAKEALQSALTAVSAELKKLSGQQTMGETMTIETPIEPTCNYHLIVRYDKPDQFRDSGKYRQIVVEKRINDITLDLALAEPSVDIREGYMTVWGESLGSSSRLRIVQGRRKVIDTTTAINPKHGRSWDNSTDEYLSSERYAFSLRSTMSEAEQRRLRTAWETAISTCKVSKGRF